MHSIGMARGVGINQKCCSLGAFLFYLLLLIAQPVLARDLFDEEKAIIAKAVMGELTDPESARFKWVPLPAIGAKVYCGLVNSKNRLGGYAGDAPYIVFLVWVEQTIKMAAPLKIGSNDPASSASIATLKSCEENGYKRVYLAE